MAQGAQDRRARWTLGRGAEVTPELFARQWFLRIPAPLDGQRRPLWVSANDHSHWRVRQQRAKLWRESGRVACLQARLPKGIQRVTVDVVLHYKIGSRSRDALNLALTAKHALDGCTDYGFWPDDNDKHIASLTIRAGEQLAHPALSITLTEETP